MTVVLWTFVAISLIAWGRGTFCGWLCPFGALQELVSQVARAAGVKSIRIRAATDAKLKIDLVNDHLAGKEMEIGRFYQHSGKLLAGAIRFRVVIDRYQSTSHTPEALHRLVECYLALGIPEEAKKSAAVLNFNYPGSKWYDRSYELIGKKVA